MARSAEISERELLEMESTLKLGLQMCYKLRKKMGGVSTRPIARKGLKGTQVVQIIGKRRTRIIG